MGDSLFDLEQTLRSNQCKITREEAMILQACKAKAVRAFTVTASLSSGAMWAAMWKLGYLFGSRIGIAGGAGMFSGMWMFNTSLNNSVDKILSMEGSRMQSELANLILSKYQHDSWRMQLMKKHFYMERVFDDTNQDRPISRWRFRHYFGESHRSHDSDSNKDYTDTEPRQTTDSKQVNLQSSTSPGFEMLPDPFDCVFGYQGKNEEIHHPVRKTTDCPPKRRSCDHKRAHRRRRVHHAEA